MLLENTTIEFLNKLASGDPVPGGGGASAAVGAFAAALGSMVSNLTIGKKKYAAVEDEVKELKSQLQKLQEELILLVDKDAEAFLPLAEAYRLPKNTEEEQAYKAQIMEEALYGASVLPIQMMETILEVMKILEELSTKGSRLAISDVGTGLLFAQAALEGASLNVYINAGMMKNQERAKQLIRHADDLIREGQELKERAYKIVLEQIR